MKIQDLVWKEPLPEPILSLDEIHVWRASLEQPDIRIHEFIQILSADERLRAERFHFEQDQRRFIVCRGLLRTILGQYLKIKPNQVLFQHNSHGKPYLSRESCSDTLRFNLAHSHELAVYAIVYDREIGIDLEYIHLIPEAEQIAARFFSTDENTRLQTLSENQKLEGFFNCWTRKEAFIKATGDGFARNLKLFDVSLAPGEAAQLLHVEGYPEEVSRWSLVALTPGDGYVAALAVEAVDWKTSQTSYHTP